MKPSVVKGNLLDQDVDVLVNTWNRNPFPWWLLLPQGVSGAIKKRAGVEPFNELSRHGLIPLGGAVMTSSGKLPHQAIIHVAGINLAWMASEFSIRQSTINSYELALARGFKSIAYPIIGSGSGSYSKEKALEVMLSALDSYDDEVLVKIVHFAGED